MVNSSEGLATSGGNIKIDLSNYALKEDTATKVDLETLSATVANKVDINPPHTHYISQINQLETELNACLKVNKTYAYNSILSNPEEINYLKEPYIPNLHISTAVGEAGYIISINSITGDLEIKYNNVVIMSYNKSSGHWIIGGVDIQEFITNTNDILQNHYNAINILATQHSLTDSNTTDGNKFTIE